MHNMANIEPAFGEDLLADDPAILSGAERMFHITEPAVSDTMLWRTMTWTRDCIQWSGMFRPQPTSYSTFSSMTSLSTVTSLKTTSSPQLNLMQILWLSSSHYYYYYQRLQTCHKSSSHVQGLGSRQQSSGGNPNSVYSSTALGQATSLICASCIPWSPNRPLRSRLLLRSVDTIAPNHDELVITLLFRKPRALTETR